MMYEYDDVNDVCVMMYAYALSSNNTPQ